MTATHSTNDTAARPAEDAPAALADSADAEFDIREFARTARGSHRAELDLTVIAEEGLAPDAARLLRALRDLERSTMGRMRNLLVTATHKDARVTAFLTTWAYEKFWLADALDAVLDASGTETVLPEEKGALRHDRRERVEHRGPIRRAFLANFAGPQLVAAHVTTGLIDEWVTQAAYRRLGALAQGVGSFVDTVLEIKDRHIRFLHQEAQRRLAASPRAVALTKKEIVRSAWPIGSIERTADERSFFERVVFGGPEGSAEAGRIGALISSLPHIGQTVGTTVEARLAP